MTTRTRQTMNLDRVTVTGADDSIDPDQLWFPTLKFPFVEWGILLSASQSGGPRFPSAAWIERLRNIREEFNAKNPVHPMRLCAHLCGRWVREMCLGLCTVKADLPGVFAAPLMFDRIQLNFHAQAHQVRPVEFVAGLKGGFPVQHIFQIDGVNGALLDAARAGGIDAVPLFDTSGGAGVLPARGWPTAQGPYCGYAGGLSPTNLETQLGHIAKACGDTRIWIDVETRVRSKDDRTFDLDEVDAFLSAALPYVQSQ